MCAKESSTRSYKALNNLCAFGARKLTVVFFTLGVERFSHRVHAIQLRGDESKCVSALNFDMFSFFGDEVAVASPRDITTIRPVQTDSMKNIDLYQLAMVIASLQHS